MRYFLFVLVQLVLLIVAAASGLAVVTLAATMGQGNAMHEVMLGVYLLVFAVSLGMVALIEGAVQLAKRLDKAPKA
jgi:hypothetical protein